MAASWADGEHEFNPKAASAQGLPGASELRAVFELSPAAQFLTLAEESGFPIIAVSNSCLALIGKPRQALIGRNLLAVLREGPIAIINEEAETILLRSLRRVTSLALADTVRLRFISEDRWFEITSKAIPEKDGSGCYILHSMEEIDSQTAAMGFGQIAARHQSAAEKPFRQLMEASELGVLIGDRTGGITYANPALLKMIEYTEADLAAGLLRWDEITPPEFFALDKEAAAQALATGSCRPYEKVYIAKSGRRVPILIGASILKSLDGKIEVAAFVADLTERTKSRCDAFLVRLDDATRLLVDPDEIVSTAARMLTEELGVDCCTYCSYDPEEQIINVAYEYRKVGTGSTLGSYPLHQFGPELVRRMKSGLPYVCHDVKSEPLAALAHSSYLSLGVNAFIAIPLVKANRLFAIMGVLQNQPRLWLPVEVGMVTAVTNRCWESIERSRVARAWQASEQRLRLAQKVAHMGSFEWLMKDDKVTWTTELEAVYGLEEGAFEGSLDDWKRRVVKEDADHVLAIIEKCSAEKNTECSYEFRAVLPDGTERWLRGHSTFFYDDAGAPHKMIGVNIDISAQKKAESDLRESESRLRAIYDGTYQYLGLLSPEGLLLEANRSLLAFAGNTIEEIRGKPFWDIPWFAGTPGATKLAQDAAQQASAGKFVRFEAALKRPSGEDSYFDISLHPVKNGRGDVVLIVPEGRDITERKLAEQRLQQQWQTFDTALSNTPDLTYTFDLEGRFTYANRRLCEVSQRSLKDTVGRSVAQLGYPKELSERILRQIRQVVETRQPLRSQTPFSLPTGEVREYEYIYQPVMGEDGNVVGIAGSTRDVTERKEAEEQLRRSEARFRQLFDSLPQLVWSSTPEGYDDLYNRQWFDYTGLSYEEVGGNGSMIIHPDDLPEALKRWAHSLATGEPYEIEYRCRRFDGEYRWFLGRARSVVDESGQVVRWFGTMTDINEKKENETALQKAHRELEEFSYVASHDLQEPLRMVNIYTQLMLKQLGEREGKIATYADYVRLGVQRMDLLISDLLSFSRTVHMETGPLGTADLSVSLQDAISLLDDRIRENAAVIIAEPLPVVCGDTQQLAHIFQNLLSNSLKYRRTDRRPEIKITAVANRPDWIISVSDNGIGFEPQYANRIFGLFKRLHKDEYPGTGLGLAICQRIVERHGGKMWAEGRPGEGATFYFSLTATDQE